MAGIRPLALYTSEISQVNTGDTLDLSVLGSGVPDPSMYLRGDGTWATVDFSATAATLQTARSISLSGAATGTASFDGSANITISTTLEDVNPSPQTNAFVRLTINSKGLVTSTASVGLADVSTALGYVPVSTAGDNINGPLGIKSILIDTSAVTIPNDLPCVVDTFTASTYRSAKYTVQITDGSMYQVAEILLMHDSVNVYKTEYAIVRNSDELGVFTADVIDGNVRLLFTAHISTIKTAKIARTTLKV